MDLDPDLLVGSCCQVQSGLLAKFQEESCLSLRSPYPTLALTFAIKSTLIKANISESAVRWLLLTVDCVVEEHTDGVSFLNEMFWHQPLSRVFPCFHLALVLERIHERMEKENSVGVLNH